MPTIYKAIVKETYEYEVTITAGNKAEAITKAREKSRARAIDEVGTRSVVEITELATVNYEVGSRINHFKFGEGIILSLQNASSGSGLFCQAAEIEFDSGKVTSLMLPLDPDRFQVLEPTE